MLHATATVTVRSRPEIRPRQVIRLPKSTVTLRGGARSRIKIFVVEGVSEGQVSGRS